DRAMAQLVPAWLVAEEWTLHAAEDLRLFDDAVVGVDAVEQGQLHVRDPAPQATVKLSNLVFATPATPERDHLVLAVLVQGRDQPLELTAVFGARVLDPESIVGLREGTLGPGFKGAALQSGLRHISKDINGPLLPWTCFGAAPCDLDPRRWGRSGSQRSHPACPGSDRRPVRLGRAERGPGRDGEVRHADAGARTRVGPAQQGRDQRPVDDSHREGNPIGERRAAQGARPLRARPPLQEYPGRRFRYDNLHL